MAMTPGAPAEKPRLEPAIVVAAGTRQETTGHGLELDQVRNWLLNGTLTASAVVGLPAMVGPVIVGLRSGWFDIAVAGILTYASIATLAFARRWLSFRVRAGVFLGVLFVIASFLSARFGEIGASSMFFCVTCVFTTVLMGMRVGMAVLLASIVVKAAVLVGIVNRVAALREPWMLDLHTDKLTNLVSVSVIYVLLCGALVVAIGLAQERLQRSLTVLEQRNADLWNEMAERQAAEREKGSLSAQLIQAQKLEALGLLAGGVAHDINNALTVIRTGAELLGRQSFPGETGEDVASIREAADRAAGITRQLLMFSRKRTEEAQEMDLNVHIRQTRKMLGTLLGERIRLEIALADEVPLVRMDPAHLVQILMNLCANARDAMPQGGTVHVRTCKRLPERDGMPECAELVVADTGSGMDQATLRHVFEPFFTTKPVGKGTGLGLSTVHGIVRQHGGAITVESELGVGTTFTIQFPKADVGRMQSQAVVAPPERARGERILLVDDDPAVCRLVGRVLKELGYTVASTSDPLHALEMVSQGSTSCDLLLSDLRMPVMDGRELVAKARERLAGLAVLLMSAHPEDARVATDAEDPRTPVLRKPFTTDALARAIREALRMV